jgi:hypothetical protein
MEVESRGRQPLECCFRVTNIAGARHKIKDTLKRKLQTSFRFGRYIQGLFNNYLQNQVL